MIRQSSFGKGDGYGGRAFRMIDDYAGVALMGYAASQLGKAILPSIMSKSAAESVSKGALYIGAAYQGVRWWNMANERFGWNMRIGLPSSQSQADAGSLFLGDGMSYDVVPLAGAHDDMGGLYAGAHDDMGGLYMDARPSDAMSAGQDLSGQERMAALGGAHVYASAFGEASRQIQNSQGQSAHAGKHGHRWGWMIHMLGFRRFQKLAALPAHKRVEMIAKLKHAAISAARSQFDSSEAQGYSGYGSLALDSMGSLAIDQSFSGLAVVGANI